MNLCSYCNVGSVELDGARCYNCGAVLCPTCSVDSAGFCPDCGYPLNKDMNILDSFRRNNSDYLVIPYLDSKRTMLFNIDKNLEFKYIINIVKNAKLDLDKGQNIAFMDYLNPLSLLEDEATRKIVSSIVMEYVMIKVIDFLGYLNPAIAIKLYIELEHADQRTINLSKLHVYLKNTIWFQMIDYNLTLREFLDNRVSHKNKNDVTHLVNEKTMQEAKLAGCKAMLMKKNTMYSVRYSYALDRVTVVKKDLLNYTKDDGTNFIESYYSTEFKNIFKYGLKLKGWNTDSRVLKLMLYNLFAMHYVINEGSLGNCLTLEI